MQPAHFLTFSTPPNANKEKLDQKFISLSTDDNEQLDLLLPTIKEWNSIIISFSTSLITIDQCFRTRILKEMAKIEFSQLVLLYLPKNNIQSVEDINAIYFPLLKLIFLSKQPSIQTKTESFSSKISLKCLPLKLRILEFVKIYLNQIQTAFLILKN